MSKGWGKVAAGGALALLLANQASPGTAGKVLTNAGDTAKPVVDESTSLLNEHLVPAASETITATKDGLASTNLLGPSGRPAWAEPVDPAAEGGG